MRALILSTVAAGLIVAGCSNDPGNALPTGSTMGEQRVVDGAAFRRIVVANRNSGTVSVIDARTNEVVAAPELPAEAGEPTPEPMYVVYTPQMNRVFVGDRANDRVAVFDASGFDIIGTAPTGAGVWHMWADPQGSQLWVNGDIDNTTTVIDPSTLDVIATIQSPDDLVAMGGHPHDVIVGPMGRYAYVSMVGLPGDNDYVIQYDTSMFTETARAAVGKDPHLSLARQSPYLFVPCQGSDAVFVLDRISLSQVAEIPVPGAHGAGMTRDGRYFYTSNLPGGGMDAIFTIDTRDLTVVGEGVDAPYAVPHNIALTPSGDELFLTHSGGTSDKVTVYSILANDPVPVYVTDVTVQLNPFGITFVP